MTRQSSNTAIHRRPDTSCTLRTLRTSISPSLASAGPGLVCIPLTVHARAIHRRQPRSEPSSTRINQPTRVRPVGNLHPSRSPQTAAAKVNHRRRSLQQLRPTTATWDPRSWRGICVHGITRCAGCGWCGNDRVTVGRMCGFGGGYCGRRFG